MFHEHHWWWRFYPRKELTQIYFSAATRSFAVSLLSLFVPLYLYKELGYSLNETLLFFVAYSLVLAFVTPFAAKFSARFGCKHSVLISVPFYLLFIVGLYWLPTLKIPLPLIASLFGISLSFYWMGMHLVFRKASDRKHRGEEFGKKESISIFSTMLGPILGGVLIKYLGFKPVFVLAAMLLFISAFFLFLSKEKHVRYHFSLHSILDRKHWKDALFFISRGSRVIASGVIWPLFVFIIVKDYLSLGVLESVLAGLSALVLWGVGKFSDHYDRKKILHYVAGFESIAWLFRSIISSVAQAFGAAIFSSVTYGIYESTAGALEYDKAKGNETEYFVSREIFICIGRIMILSVVLITNSLTGGMIFHSIANLAAFLF
jgi:MFS family permease